MNFIFFQFPVHSLRKYPGKDVSTCVSITFSVLVWGVIDTFIPRKLIEYVTDLRRTPTIVGYCTKRKKTNHNLTAWTYARVREQQPVKSWKEQLVCKRNGAA